MMNIIFNNPLGSNLRLSLVVILLAVSNSLWAADGWYLLIPPRTAYNEHADYLRGYEILYDKPLSQWGQEGAYDSASECEAVRNSLLMIEQGVYSESSKAYIKDVGAKADSSILNFERFSTEIKNANVWAYMGSRCIGSKDPRLR